MVTTALTRGSLRGGRGRGRATATARSIPGQGNSNKGRGKGKKRQRSGTDVLDLNLDILQDDDAHRVPLTQNAPPPEDI
jgi:hypothetical protein